jgi:hypothetical protein
LQHLQRLAQQEVGTPLRFAYSNDPELGIELLREQACQAFGLSWTPGSGVLDAPAFNFYLRRFAKRGGRAALAVDDAQAFPARALAQLVELSPEDPAGGGCLMQLLLTGSPELVHMLESPELSALADRIADRVELSGLEHDEMRSFIEDRLEAAGERASDLVSAEMIERIATESEGLPGEALRLCEEALGRSAGTPSAPVERGIGWRSRRRRQSSGAPREVEGIAVIESTGAPPFSRRLEVGGREREHRLEARERVRADSTEGSDLEFEDTRERNQPAPDATIRPGEPDHEHKSGARGLDPGRAEEPAAIDPAPVQIRTNRAQEVSDSDTGISLASLMRQHGLPPSRAKAPLSEPQTATGTWSIAERDGETLVLKLHDAGSAGLAELVDRPRHSPVPSIAQLAAGRAFPAVANASAPDLPDESVDAIAADQPEVMERAEVSERGAGDLGVARRHQRVPDEDLALEEALGATSSQWPMKGDADRSRSDAASGSKPRRTRSTIWALLLVLVGIGAVAAGLYWAPLG